MQIVPNNKKSTFLAKIICRELLQLFRASQFGLVYTLNVALVFFGLGALVSFFLINSGNFFIDIVNFLLKKLAIPDGYYHGSYSLSGFFWYSYLFITLIIYIAEKLWCKKFGKDDIIISVKYKIIAIPILVCFGYALIICFFSLKYGFWSVNTLILSVFLIATVIANYYYLLISFIVDYIDNEMFKN